MAGKISARRRGARPHRTGYGVDRTSVLATGILVQRCGCRGRLLPWGSLSRRAAACPATGNVDDLRSERRPFRRRQSLCASGIEPTSSGALDTATRTRPGGRAKCWIYRLQGAFRLTPHRVAAQMRAEITNPYGLFSLYPAANSSTPLRISRWGGMPSGRTRSFGNGDTYLRPALRRSKSARAAARRSASTIRS